MAVIITNMDMPKDCYVCKLGGRCVYRQSRIVCDGRPKDCPLKEVSNGEWLTDTQMLDETGYKYKCSNCGYGSMEDYEFCPQCGSDNRDD